MAYKNAIMVRRRDPGEQLLALPRARRDRRPYTRRTASSSTGCSRSCSKQGITGPEGASAVAAARGRGRSGQPRHPHSRSRSAPLYIVHNSCRQSLEAITRARHEGQRVFGEVLAGHLLIDDSVYRNDELGLRGRTRDEPAVPRNRTPGRAVGGLQAGTLQTTATDHCCFCADAESGGQGRLSAGSRTARAASKTAWRCCGRTASAPGG